MKQIIIQTEKLSFLANLNESQTAQQIWDALPITSSVSTWGDEIYFRIPVNFEVEKSFAKEIVTLGDLAFWPEGSCFCIFFGPTPISKEGEIRPASTVNIIGKIEGGLGSLKAVSEGSEIMVRRAARAHH